MIFFIIFLGEFVQLYNELWFYKEQIFKLLIEFENNIKYVLLSFKYFKIIQFTKK